MIPFDELEIKTVEKIEVESGDVLAVYVKNRISHEETERLRLELQKSFLPRKVNVIVLNYELVKLQVIKPVGDSK